MAGPLQKSSQSVDPYLSRNQQDLLLAALNSQAGVHQPANRIVGRQAKLAPTDEQTTMSASNADTLFMSPGDAHLDSFGVDFTPDLDYLDGDGYDFEDADLGGDMIGALPGTGAEGGEKRKSPDERAGSEEGDAKRQETQDGEKTAKKPGRKPLTSEPTTKRKAQNRAAQRAFRERKERHLKDLETKVDELTKASEADKQENSLLKAKVDRLTVELREYRKRLSLNGSMSRSPPLASSNSQQRSNSNPPLGNAFQFDFPKFGALPGSQIFGNTGRSGSATSQPDSVAPTSTQSPPTMLAGFAQAASTQSSRQSTMNRSLSPRSNQGSISNAESPSQFANLDPSFTAYSTNDNMHGFASTLPQMSTENDPFGDLFSPSILKSTSPRDNYFDKAQAGDAVNEISRLSADTGNDSTSGLNRVFQFNGGSNSSDSTSPSASSSSQWNANGTGNSSCGTSPEPSHESPALKDKGEPYSQKSFDASQSADKQATLDATSGFPNADFSASSFGNFDPVLFGDYRESNNAIVGGGDFSGGFFDDALNSAPFDYGSPSNLFGILQSPQQTKSTPNVPNHVAGTTAPSKNLMAKVQQTCDGGDDDSGLPSTQPKKTDREQFINCNQIWNYLQSNTDYQEDKFDIDSLCSELRTKARCSESGVVVSQNHVDAAFKKLAKKDETGKMPADLPQYMMFENESWDNVLKKLGKGTQQR